MTSDLGFSLGMKRASAFGVLGVSSSSLKNGTFGPSFLVWYFLAGNLIRLCDRCREVNKDDILTGAGLSTTGKEEIPYWIEGAVPTRPIDIWGNAGSVPNGFVAGTGCTTAELGVADNCPMLLWPKVLDVPPKRLPPAGCVWPKLLRPKVLAVWAGWDGWKGIEKEWFDWPKPNVLPELIGDGVLEKLFTPNPVEEAPSIPWPKGELVLCPKEFVWPKAEPVCPIEGVEVWNNGDDWVLLGNAGFVVWDGPELKRDGEPKIDGDELTPNVDVVDNEVDPKRLVEVDALKGEELNVEAAELAKVKPPRPGVFGANRLEDIEEEKGLAADWPNVGEGDELKPIPPAGWPAGSGPPLSPNW
jgi:hypothetical protein